MVRAQLDSILNAKPSTPYVFVYVHSGLDTFHASGYIYRKRGGKWFLHRLALYLTRYPNPYPATGPKFMYDFRVDAAVAVSAQRIDGCADISSVALCMWPDVIDDVFLEIDSLL